MNATTAEDTLLEQAAEVGAASLEGDATDIKGQIVAVLTDGNLSQRERNDRVSGLVVAALTQRGAFYFHAQHRDFATAMFFDAETKRLLRIQADEFVAWLSSWTGINRGAHLFKYVQAAVETATLSGDNTSSIIPESYFASRPVAFYISSGDGQVVKITPGRVELVDNGADGVLFTAGATLPSWTLTAPVDPFTVCDLFRDASAIDPHGKTLLQLWLVSLPTNPPCKPPLVLAGQIRSGKTRTARGICELLGLPFRSVAPKQGDKALADFWTSADAGGILTADNVDSRVDWLPDAVAAAATGVGDVRRKLYSDAAQVELRPRAWLILTAATPLFASDVGLSDRLLVVRLGQRTGETSDEALSKQIAAHRDAGLSWLAKTLAAALTDTAPTPQELNRRHPDFAAFAVRIGRALNCEAEAVAALRAAETDKSRFCLENDPVGAALLVLLADGKTFTGTAAELLVLLAKYDSDFGEDATGRGGKRLWSAKRLGKRLAAIWLHVESVADAVRETDRKGFSVFIIKPRSAEFAEFETLIPINSPAREHIGSLPETVNETRQTRQPDRSDLLPSQAEMASFLNGAKP